MYMLTVREKRGKSSVVIPQKFPYYDWALASFEASTLDPVVIWAELAKVTDYRGLERMQFYCAPDHNVKACIAGEPHVNGDYLALELQNPSIPP